MRIQCPKCQHRWEHEAAGGVIVCPNCGFTATMKVPAATSVAQPRPADQKPTSIAPGPPPKPVADDMPTSLAAGPPRTPPDTPKAGKSKAEGRTGGGTQSPRNIDLSGQTIGGFRVSRMLGAGGMGAVCLARQVSLDREVALKILPSGMAKNPDFLMRFTREALSAAQLTHHNIIQIYDIGQDGEIHFISMEYVRGQTLSELVRSKGRLDPKAAAGYVLQAARGLEYAHKLNIIHRDIKPDNLMLNDLGVVKIADMGLAKIRSEASRSESSAKITIEDRNQFLQRARGDLTMGDVAMGTPAYMPPEQARDASTVDHRADQYSLGCTLYHLCTGKPPFSGATAYDLINKHMAEPPPELGRDIPEAPREMNAIIQKMMAKEPSDRYPDTSAVIAALEQFLGLSDPRGRHGPTPQNVQALNEAQKAFYGAPSRKRLRAALAGYAAGLTLLILAFAVAGQTGWLDDMLGRGGSRDIVVALLSLLILSPVMNFMVDGVLNHTFLFRRIRSVMGSLSKRTWLIMAGSLLFVVAVFGSKLVFGVLGAVGASFLYQVLIKRPLWNERRAPLERVREMLKELRVLGMSEEALQEFVARYGGEDWEEFFEGLFGYSSLLVAREKWGLNEAGRPRRQYATWREPISRWLDRVEARARERRDRGQLQRAEAERLKAQGMEARAAQKQAEIEASRIIRHGFRETDLTPALPVQRPTGAEEAQAAQKEQARKQTGVRYGRGSRPVFEVDQWIRLVAGLVFCGLYGLGSFVGIDPIPAMLKLQHHNDELGLVAGLMLMISAFSGRTGTSMLILVGAVLMVASVPVAGLVGNPSFSAEYCMGLGVLMILGGFFVPVLGKLTGGRY